MKRGAQQLNSASDTVVKAKSIDQIELKPVNEFDKFRNIVKVNGQLVLFGNLGELVKII